MRPCPETPLWDWVNERHRIYIHRTAGNPKPWTDDPVLRRFKFTNVFRQLDRGTVWLTDHFIAPHWNDQAELIVHNVAWYRAFNWTGTGKRLGWRRSWRPDDIKMLLHREQARGKQIFTGAHIVWSEPGSKIDGIVDMCRQVWLARHHIALTAGYTNSLEQTFNLLTQIRGIGGFLGYEIVTDLRHTRLLDQASDINTWANVGPGAFRGLKRIAPEIRYRDALPAMIRLLEQSRAPGVLEAHVPPLELRDIEHSLCEFDKFQRAQLGEGRPRSRYPGDE